MASTADVVRPDSSPVWQAAIASCETEQTTNKQLCTVFHRNWQCDSDPCQYGLHLPLNERPYCSRFLHNGSCSFETECWWRHELPPALRLRRDCNLFLQCHWTHEVRLMDFLQAQFGSEIEAVTASRYFGACRKDDRILFVKCGNPRALLSQLMEAKAVLRQIPRSYIISGCVETWDEALVQLSNALSNLATDGLPELLIRSQTYPNNYELPLVEALEAYGLPDRPATAIAGVMRGWHARVCLVYVGGYYYYGVETPTDPSVSSAAAEVSLGTLALVGPTAGMPPTVCRAQYKLLEVLDRVPAVAAVLRNGVAGRADAGAGVGEIPRIAIDVGAAPGGWTLALAAVCKHDIVYAVDPAALCENPPMPSSVQHLRMTGQAAVEMLSRQQREKHAQVRPLLSAYACDMNCPTPGTLTMLEQAGPLLLPGAAVVLTLKNFDGKRPTWVAVMAKVEARFRELCSDVKALHLFANGPDEITICGLWKGGDAL